MSTKASWQLQGQYGYGFKLLFYNNILQYFMYLTQCFLTMLG